MVTKTKPLLPWRLTHHVVWNACEGDPGPLRTRGQCLLSLPIRSGQPQICEQFIQTNLWLLRKKPGKWPALSSPIGADSPYGPLTWDYQKPRERLQGGFQDIWPLPSGLCTGLTIIFPPVLLYTWCHSRSLNTRVTYPEKHRWVPQSPDSNWWGAAGYYRNSTPERKEILGKL